MIRRVCALALLCFCLPVILNAQGASVVTGTGEGAVLRTLDKVTGNVIDVEMISGQTMGYGTLEVTLTECRFPTNNPSGDAFAHLIVMEGGTQRDIFQGWMIASSPALMALDHPRYDVWVLRCITS